MQHLHLFTALNLIRFFALRIKKFWHLCFTAIFIVKSAINIFILEL